MPYQLFKKNDTNDTHFIKLSPNGTTMKTLEEDISSYQWESALIHMCQKTYKIELSFGHPDFYAIIKPVQEYHCATFEEVFGFGVYCNNFTKNRIVALITNPT